MRRPPIPPLCGGAGQALPNFPTDSWRPPTPSFPPYDVRTLHFVACGRPWLLHWRGVHTHRIWSHFWDKFLGKCGNTQIHLLHMIHMGHDTHDTHDTYSQDSSSLFWDKCGKHTEVGHMFGTNSLANVGIDQYICYISYICYIC